LTCQVLAPASILQSIAYTRYVVSSDRMFILLATEHEKLYRHSSFDVYLVYDVNDQSIQSLANGERLRWAEWSPTGHRLAYVQDNNLFVHSWKDAQQPVQVTSDGAVNQIINGVCDWAYEEEVFSRTSALWW